MVYLHIIFQILEELYIHKNAEHMHPPTGRTKAL